MLLIAKPIKVKFIQFILSFEYLSNF